MKTKIAILRSSWMGLSLSLATGIAFALPEVESHAQAGWVSNNSQVSGEANENAALGLLRKVELLQQEIQELRGKLEEQGYQLTQLKDNQKKLYLDLDKRLTVLQPGSASIQPEASQPVAPVNVPLPTSNVSHDEGLAEEKAYQQAYHFVQNKDYGAAALAFQSLVKSFPQGKYAPNAHYWLGEIYMAKGELNLAFDAFHSVYQRYPEHPKAADSLLKLGYVEYAKGQWKRSQDLLTQVKDQFPGSTSAQLAEARLQRMHKEGHL